MARALKIVFHIEDANGSAPLSEKKQIEFEVPLECVGRDLLADQKLALEAGDMAKAKELQTPFALWNETRSAVGTTIELWLGQQIETLK